MPCYLRIAASTLSLIACTLLVVLWMRSYLWMDQSIRPVTSTNYFGCTSIDGQLMFGLSNDPPLDAAFGRYGRKWTRRGFPLKKWDEAARGPVAYFPAARPRGIACWPRFSKNPYRLSAIGSTHYEAVVPYWLLVLLTAAIAAAPWNKWRFSLRMLVIAMPLIAILLGIIRAVGR